MRQGDEYPQAAEPQNDLVDPPEEESLAGGNADVTMNPHLSESGRNDDVTMNPGPAVLAQNDDPSPRRGASQRQVRRLESTQLEEMAVLREQTLGTLGHLRDEPPRNDDESKGERDLLGCVQKWTGAMLGAYARHGSEIDRWRTTATSRPSQKRRIDLAGRRITLLKLEAIPKGLRRHLSKPELTSLYRLESVEAGFDLNEPTPLLEPERVVWEESNEKTDSSTTTLVWSSTQKIEEMEFLLRLSVGKVTVTKEISCGPDLWSKQHKE